MKTRGTDQRSVSLQRLVRKLSRREGTALTLPLTLALIGTAIARERTDQDDASTRAADHGNHADAGKNGVVAQPGDKLALFAGDEAIAEHLLTEADAAAGQVRIALRMIKDAAGNASLHGIPTVHAVGAEEQSAAGSADPEQAQAAEGANGAAAGNAGNSNDGAANAGAGAGNAGGDAASEAMAQSGDREVIVLAAAGDNAAATAATAQDDDDHHRGLIWLVVGIGAAGAGIALANNHHDRAPAADGPPDTEPPPPASVSGQVVKGYVQGAAVYLDTNHDGVPDGEPVYTDAQGRFTFQGGDTNASIIVYGGVDTLTNVPLDGMILRAPSGATVVTPLTTLIDEMTRQDSSLNASQAQSKLVAALGITLPAGTDLLTYDSVKDNANGGAGIEDRSEAVLSTLSAVQSLLTGAGAAGAVDAANAAISAIAQVLLQKSGAVDLSSASDVQSVLEAAFQGSGVGASNGADLESLASAIAAVNGALMEATGLGESALQATRYALSGFQDLLTGIGANAHATEQYSRDISFGSNDALASAVEQVAGGTVGDAIGDHSAASISFAERLEGGRFVFALNPELKLYQGAPDKIDTVTVKFDVADVVVQRETRGANGEITVETLTPDADGRYALQYGELDKIFITPPAQFNGTLGADVTVHYVGLGVTDAPDTLGIDITAVNDAPTGTDSSVAMLEDKHHVFSISDFPFTDANDAAYAGGANALGAVKIVSLPQAGTLYLGDEAVTPEAIANGLFVSASDIENGLLTFVPAPGANGAAYASFQFLVQDDGGTAHGGVDFDPTAHTLTIDVTAVNDAPTSAGNTLEINEDTRHVFSKDDFAFSDSDGNDLASVLITALPENGKLYFGDLEITLQDLVDGKYPISAADLDAGKLSFLPDANYHGSIALEYQVQDNGGTAHEGVDLSETATLTFDVASVSDSPVAANNSATIHEDSLYTFSAADFNFTDADDNGLAAVIITSLPGNGALYYHGEEVTSLAEGGLVVSVEDLEGARLEFVPDENANGEIAFGYKLRDDGGTVNGGSDTSDTATFTFTVEAVNDAPVATGSTVSLTEEQLHEFVLSDFPFTDVENNALAAVRISSLPDNGTLYYGEDALSGEDLGEDGYLVSAADIAAGKLVFVPDSNFNGQVSFGYQVQDDGGTALDGSDTSNTATFTFTVESVNDAPVASDNTLSLTEDESHTFAVSDFVFTDTENNGLAAVRISALPENGTLYFGEDALSSDDIGEDGYPVSAADIEAGKLVFVPDQDFHGQVTLGYQVQDDGGTDNGGHDLSSPATLTFNIASVNDAPTASAGSATLDEDGSYVFGTSDFPFTDVDDDALAAVIIRSLPDNGTLYLDGEGVTSLGEDGLSVSLADLQASKLSFVPAENANGEITFSYQVQDDGGTANDGIDTSELATFTLNVTAVSDAPVAIGNELSLDEDQTYTFSAGDFKFTDVDGDGLSKVLITSLPDHGSLYYGEDRLYGEDLGEDGYLISAEDLTGGKLTFVPDANYNGSASFQYEVQDSGSGDANHSGSATIAFTVNPVSDAPMIAETDTVSIDEDGSRVLSSELFGFTDADGDDLAAVLITSLPENGKLYFGEDQVTSLGEGGYFSVSVEDLDGGKLVFVPDANYNGPITLGYELQDDSGVEGKDTSEPATLSFDVVAVNDAPVASDNTIHTNEDHSRTLHAADFEFTDEENNDLASVLITSLPEHGTLYYGEDRLYGEDLGEDGYRVTAQDLEDGKLIFVPDADYNGSVTLSYKVQDNGGGTDTSVDSATLTIDVKAVNDDPELSLPCYSTDVSPDANGEQYLVNTTTTGSQEDPAIAALSDGGYVVVWISKGQDGSGYGIYAQRYDANGEKAGVETLINTTTANDQFDPVVIARPDGGFNVVWSSAVTQSGSNITDADIVTRSFDATGTALTEESRINTTTASVQFEPAIAATHEGMVVVWTSDGANGYDVYAQRYDADGAKVGDEVRVNTATAYDQYEPAVAVLSDGSYVVTWTGHDGDDDSQGVFAQRFDADGTKSGEEVRLNVDVEGNQTQPAIAALNDGGYVVTWTGQDESLTGIYSQRYDRFGEAVGKQVLVNSVETNDQIDPAVTALPTGGYVITWTSWGSVDSTLDVYAQRFGVDGEKLGDAVLVNSHTTYEQTSPAIAVLADGSVVVTWQSNNEDGNAYGVYAQRFEPIAPNFIEGGDAVVIAPMAKVTDIELDALNEGQGNWTGASLVIERKHGDSHGGWGGGSHSGWGFGGHGHAPSPDHFSFQDGDGYELLDDGALIKDGELLGHFSVEDGKLVVTFGSPETSGDFGIESVATWKTPTTADVNYVLQHVTYWSSSDNPGESVELSYRVEDGNAHWNGEQGSGGEGRDSGTVLVQLTNVNDAPEPRDNTVHVSEDHTHEFDLSDFRFHDAEGNELQSVTITSLPEHGTLYFNGEAVTPDQIEAGFTLTRDDLVCERLTFTPDENFNGTVSFGYQIQDDSGTARDGKDTSEIATMQIDVHAVNDAPELSFGSGYTYVVDTLDDTIDPMDGKTSLREAVLAAQTNGLPLTSITFDPSLAGQTIDLTLGSLYIGSSVYINGNPGGVPGAQITLQMNAAQPALIVDALATEVVLSNLVIAGSGTLQALPLMTNAPAVQNSGGLTLEGVEITGFLQQATGEAVSVNTVLWNGAGATLNMSNVLIDGNEGHASPGLVSTGGNAALIVNSGTIEAVDVTVIGNTVQGGLTSEGMGGGAYLVVNNGTINGDIDFGDEANTTSGGAGIPVGDAGTAYGYEPSESTFVYVPPLVSGGPTASYTEGADAVVLAPAAAVSDIDLDALNGGAGDWSGASISIGRKDDGEDSHHGWGRGGHGGHGGHDESDDEYGFVDGNDLTFVDGNIVKTVESVESVIGHYSVSHSGKLTITFSTASGEGSAVPTTADVNHVLQQVTYKNLSDDPDESVTLQYRVEDGNRRWHGEQGTGGELHVTGELTVNITPVNDAPEPRHNGLHLLEDHGHTFEVSDFRFRDAEHDELKSVRITSLPEHGTLYYNGEPVTLEQIDGGFTVSREDLECGRFVFEPAEDFHGSMSFGYQLQDDGGTSNGGIDMSVDATFEIDVRSVNDAPELTMVSDASDTNYGELVYQSHIADGESTDGLGQARNVTVSPDGNNVYVVGFSDNSLTVFARDAQTGELTYLTQFKDGVDDIDGLNGPYDVTVSPDGKFVYVAGSGDSAIAVFSRDSVTGELSYANENATGVTGARALVISADGLTAYAAAYNGNSVVFFTRDPETGALTAQQTLTDGADGIDGLNSARELVVSADGRNVYVASWGDDSVTILNRDADGYLSFGTAIRNGDDGVEGLGDAASIAISADGKSVYVAGNADSAISEFSRDADTGALTYLGVMRDGIDGVDGLGAVRAVTVSPDGLTVYAAADTDNSVAVFARDPETGSLTFLNYIQDGSAGAEGLAGAFGIAVSPDGQNVYVASQTDNAVAVLGRETHEAPQFVENGEAVLVTPWARVSDAELDARNEGEGNWSGASITVQRKDEGHGSHHHGGGHHGWGHHGHAGAADQYGFQDGNDLTFVDGNIVKTVESVESVIGHYSTSDHGKLVITFSTAEGEGSAIPTSDDVNHVLQQLTYSNTSDNPDSSVTLQYRVEDGNGNWHGSQGLGGEGHVVGEITVNITQVNDAPVIETPPIVTLDEDDCYAFSKSDFKFTDAEHDHLQSVVINTLPENGTLLFNGEAVTSEQVSCGFSVTAEDLRCGRLTFEPHDNYYGSTTFSFQVQDDGGTSNDGVNTSEVTTFTFDMRSVNDAPDLALPVASGYTFVVDTLVDIVDDVDGKLSLREALAQAQDGDSITFSTDILSAGSGTIVLGSTLSIDKGVYINGAIADGTITLSRGPAFTAAMVQVSEDVGAEGPGAVLQGLVLNGNYTTIHVATSAPESTAAGLVNMGELTLHGVTVMNQVVESDNPSSPAISAVYNGPNASLEATDTLITFNGSFGFDNALGDGGSAYTIFNAGTMSVDGITLTYNSMTGGDSSLSTGGDAYTLWNVGTTFIGDIVADDNTFAAGTGLGADGTWDPSGVGGTSSSGPADLTFVPPQLDGGDVATADYTAMGDAVQLAPEASLHDVELDVLNDGAGNWSGATITVQRQGEANTDDVFGHQTTVGFMPPAISWNEDDGTIRKNEDVIGTFSSSNGVLSIHFTGYGSAIPTTDDVNEVLRQITYSNSSTDPEEQVVVEYTVADGNLSFHGPQGSGGEGVTVGTVTVNVTPPPLGTPSVTLEEASSDTGSLGDGITSTIAPQFHVELPELAYAGNVLKLFVEGNDEPIATYTLTEGDLTAGWVSVLSQEAILTGKVVAQLVGENGNSESALSAPFFLDQDTTAPEAPVFDVESVTLRADNAANYVMSGTAEALSTVSVQLSADGRDPVTYTTTADGDGHFSVQVDASTLGAEVAVSATATDRAGNVSGADTSTMSIVVSSPSANVLPGTPNDDFLAPTIEPEDGVRPAVTFMPGTSGGEDHLLAPSNVFSKVVIGGSSADYSITLIDGDERATQETLVSTQSLHLDENQALYRVEKWTDGGDTSLLWVQANSLEFTDGTVRLTTNGIVGGSLAGGGQVLHGYLGDDRIVAGAGDDTLFGHDGTNTLLGNDGNDTLVSSGADDTLIGGAGNDKLVVFGDAGSGADSKAHLVGGEGQDVFVIAPQTGFDRDVTIHDFVIGDDKIDLSWLRVAGGASSREVTADDLHLEQFTTDLQENGSASIDLSQFVTVDGEAVSGTLTVMLAGGVSTPTLDDFILDPLSSTLQTDDLLAQAHLQYGVG